VLQLAVLVQKALGRETGITFLPDRNEVCVAYCDHRRVREILGYVDRTGLEAGIKRMAAWALTVQSAPPPDPPVIEVASGLPRCWEISPATA